MKENVLDVLMYLFENYIDEDTEIEPDRIQLQDKLLEAGFPGAEIDRAFEWLENLANQEDNPLKQPLSDSALRVYTERETDRLDARSRGFLLFLEQNGVLDAATRELVIDRIMDLDAEDISLDQLKWVTLMVLFNRPDQEAAYTWLESMMFDSSPEYLH
jgi:Smg protein